MMLFWYPESLGWINRWEHNIMQTVSLYQYDFLYCFDFLVDGNMCKHVCWFCFEFIPDVYILHSGRHLNTFYHQHYVSYMHGVNIFV
jgi:hypothetical protein